MKKASQFNQETFQNYLFRPIKADLKDKFGFWGQFQVINF